MPEAGTADLATGRRRRTRSPRQIQEDIAYRHAIVLRAVEFFAHNGYAKTTLQTVAESVGLTRTGLLHHFQSKDGLFNEAIEECRRWASAQLRSGPPVRGLAGVRALSGYFGNAEDRVWILFVQMLQGEALHDDAAVQVREFVAGRLSQITAYVQERLVEAQTDGELGDGELGDGERGDGERGDTSVETLTQTVAATVNGLQMLWLLDAELDVRAAFSTYVDRLGGPRPA